MSDPITIVTIIGGSTSALISTIKLIKILCDYKDKRRRRRDFRHLRIHARNMSTSDVTDTQLQAFITSTLDSILTQWAGKQLNLTALFSIITQAKTLVEGYVAESTTTNSSVRNIVTQAITDLLTNSAFVAEIDKFCTPSEIALLQEFLPYGLNIVFSEVQVDISSCWSWFIHLFKKKVPSLPIVKARLASQAQPRPTT